MQPAVVYAEELDRLGYGRPIWMPEHPTEASIELGDVGFIETRSFAFFCLHLFDFTDGVFPLRLRRVHSLVQCH